MKILFLTLRTPFPPQRGDKIRAYNFIRYIVEAGGEVDLICFAETEADLESAERLKGLCGEVKAIRFSKARAALGAALALFKRSPLQNGYWFSRKLRSAVRSMLKGKRYDLIHAQLFRMGQYVSRERMPKVLDLSDSMALNLQRRMMLDRSPSFPLLFLEHRRVWRYEVEIARRFDASIVASPVDRDHLLMRDPSLRIHVIPTAVDTEYFRPSNEPYEHMVLFTGTMGYFPNDDAVLYFHREILPLIKRAVPDIKFYVVGNNPPPKVRALEVSGDTVVTGHVDDVRPYFRRAAVFVCPLRSGSGIQTKNLEAMAMGVPVVTTSFGFEGIEGVPGRDLLVADDPSDFAREVIGLIKDGGWRARIGLNGRKLVESKYSWRAVGKRLVEVYEEVLRGWGRG